MLFRTVSHWRYFWTDRFLRRSVPGPVLWVFNYGCCADGAELGRGWRCTPVRLTGFASLLTRGRSPLRNGRRVVVARMKAHEKAQLVWEVLLDDDVIRRQLQVWWHGTARFLVFSIRYHAGRVFSMTVWLVFWLIPDVAGEIVEQIRRVSGRPCGQVGCGGADINVCHPPAYAWVIWNVQMDRLPVNCFREAFSGESGGISAVW
ncbi:Uncharacterised protein [Citrobacter freundii]|nr:Uncharacterised protein [Citrobacter freundii]